MKRRVLAGVSVATAAGIAVTATVTMNAQAAWTSAWNVSPSGWTADDSPRVSVDRQGDALLTWRACDLSTTYCHYRIQTRVKSASGTTGAIRTLSPEGASVTWPEADSDDTGDSAVVWEQDGHVVGRRVAASGSLVGTVQRLSTSGPATGPVVAVTPGGTAMAAWTEIRDGSWYAVARRLKVDGTLGGPITLGSGSAEKPAIGVDRNGQFVVAWVRGSEVVAKRIKDTVSATKVLTSPIASYGGFGMVRVGVDRDGDAVVSYRSGGGTRPQVWTSRWSRTGTLASPLRISASTDNVGFHHALGTDLDGDSVVVWTRYNSSKKLELVGRRLSAGGTRSTTTTLGLGDRPDLALDDDGDGMLVFHTVVPTATIPYSYTKSSARLISRSGTFGTTKTLTSDGRVAQVDARPTARFTVIWQQASHPYTIKSVTGP
ncbi:hypothetical protein [Streptomyces agglomeratus]|uniref:hypothetical protein n=1 Tax=Streptomyces agglomeratus TaxID=285458 RepID=UPI00210E0507|nr:hypothetical protein [Streptomyces agglomeratus]